ncbi:MAG: hypothetical protein KatS3mg023_3900 [Armatimonadota bacterium]|nr:MAG: hypothetical protein KatS3mg023_3900 [Armatimonadota bacterium]
MAAERELTFKFTAEGIDSLLQRLQQIEAQLAQINQQASPSSPPSAGGSPPPPTPNGPTPVPTAGGGLSATQQATRNATPAPVSFAGFTAQPAQGGGWTVITPQGQQIPLGSWQELRQFAGTLGVDLPPRPQPGLGLSTVPQTQQQQADALLGLWTRLAPYTPAATALGQLAGVGARYGGLAIVGAEMHWQNMLSDVISPLLGLGGALAGVQIGAAIGSIVPGIGTLAGGIAGGAIGLGVGRFLGSDIVRPLIEPTLLRGVQLDVIEDIRRLTGMRFGFPISEYNSPAVIQLAASAAMMGLPIGRNIADRIMLLPAPLREPYAQAVLRYGADPFAIGMYGYDALRAGADVWGVGSALMAGDYTSPIITMTPGGWGMAVAREHARARAQTMLLQPQMQVASLAFETALAFGGTSAAQGALPGYQNVMSATIGALQRQRAVAIHPLEQAQLDAQIYQLQVQMQMHVPASVAMTRLGEIQSIGGERTTLAQIGLQAAQLAGMPVQQMPFSELSAAMRELAAELRRFLRENAQFLSPAQQASLRAQIAQMEFQAVPALTAQQTSILLAQTGAEFSRAVAEFGAGTIATQMLGSPIARLGVVGEQTRLLQARAMQLRQQASLPGLDYTSRQNLLATAAQMEMQASQTNIGSMLGFVSEMGGVATATWQNQMLAAQIPILQGAGGVQSIPLLQQMMGAAAGQVGVAQWQLQYLAAMGVDPMNPMYIGIQQRLLSAQAGLEQMRLQTAVVPMSAQMREQFSNVQTALGIARTTFAGYADIRGLLSAEMQLVQRRIAEIQSMPPAETPAVQAARTEEINRLLMQAAGVQMQLEEGWLDRLISTTWNAPGSFNMVASGFTRREASLFYGVLNRAFGGSASMSDYWRRQVPAFYSSLIGRTGTPVGFMETAMLPRIEGNLNVRIVVEQPGQQPITRVERVNLRDSNPLDYTLTPIMVRGGGSRQ